MTKTQIIATATESILASDLADADLDHAVSEDFAWEPTWAHDEYLRGEHDDSPEGLPLADEDEQEELEGAVYAAVRERWTAALVRHAEALALEGRNAGGSADLPIAACKYLDDHDALRGSEVEEIAVTRIGAIATAEVEALEEGECLAWMDTHGEQNPETGGFSWSLDAGDYLAARIDGEIDLGVTDNAVIEDTDESRGNAIISWWAYGVGFAEAIALALTDDETRLSKIAVERDDDA